MAATITYTPGGSADTSYVSLALANAYFADELREATWDEHESDDRSRALNQATRKFEQQAGTLADNNKPTRPSFSPGPKDTTTPQKLHFPRTTDVDSDGNVYIPESVQDAVCEQALWDLQKMQDGGDLVDHHALQDAGVTTWSGDGESATYSKSSVPRGINPAAWEMLQPFIEGGGVARRMRV